MHKALLTLELLICVAIMSGCCTTAPLQDCGYKQFALPNNNYQVGQVIAEYTKPKNKISIILDPSIEPSLKKCSDSMTIDQTAFQNAAGTLQAKANSFLSATVGGSSSLYTRASFRNTRVVSCDHIGMLGAIESKLQKGTTAYNYITYLLGQNKPKQLHVIESLFYADFTVEVLSHNDIDVGIQDALTKQLAATLGFTNVNSSTIVGTNLAVGYVVDLDIMPYLGETLLKGKAPLKAEPTPPVTPAPPPAKTAAARAR